MSAQLRDTDWLWQALGRGLRRQAKLTTRCAGHRLAFYLPDLEAGGAEKMTLRLAEAFAERGYRVDLVVNAKRGVNVAAIPANVRVVELGQAPRWLAAAAAICAFPRDAPLLVRAQFARRKSVTHLRYLPRLASYVQREQPGLVIANMWSSNFNIVWAHALAGRTTRVILTERSTLSVRLRGAPIGKHRDRLRPAAFYTLLGRLYARADARITVSDGVAEDLARATGLARRSIQTVYNPVVYPGLSRLAEQPTSHTWFADGAPPVLLAVGRLHANKNYASLIAAFAIVRRRRRARLLILGEGPERAQLEAQAAALELAGDLSLPGHETNPYRYMRRARVFVLSSRVEGLSNVLIEALACGTPVVSTDCPHGPREVLQNGAIGRLVPVDDANALAEAIVECIDDPGDAATRRRRAADFSLQKALAAYERLIEPAPVQPRSCAQDSAGGRPSQHPDP